MRAIPLLLITIAGSLVLDPALGAARAGADNRAAAVRKLCERVGVGKGAVVADVGCGGGDDTLLFADIVGPRGTVLAEDIDVNSLQQVLRKSHDRRFGQVVPVLGHTEDPRLPDGMADLVYMRFAFHHFARPQRMLERLRVDVKPGGHLVVVDRQKGPLRDPVAVAERETRHHWTGETAVVRVAREAGFEFEGVAEDLWYERDPFVLVFRRPADEALPDGDPDLPSPLDGARCVRSLPLAEGSPVRVAFVGLDTGRALLPALRESLGPEARIDDIVLEEWALDREEVPDDPTGAATERLRTVRGDLPMLESAAYDAVVFSDAYHRVWEPLQLLSRLRASIRADGFLAVLDRRGPADEERRLAGHRRRISPEQVRKDLTETGFAEVRELASPTADRFYLLCSPQ